MNRNIKEAIDFYSSHSFITDPGRHSALLNELPADVPELVDIVQGLILHIHWAEKYEVFPLDKRKEETNLRFFSKQLEQIKELDSADLNISRPPEKRLLGTCRDFSVLLCALLRHQGIPEHDHFSTAGMTWTELKPILYKK